MAGRHFLPPHTPAQKDIAAVWSQYLGLEQIGLDDNFFELGGHSLLATRIVSRLRQVFGVDIPLRNLFEFPTIAQLANSITGVQSSANPKLASIPKRSQTDGTIEEELAELENLSEGEATEMAARRISYEGEAR